VHSINCFAVDFIIADPGSVWISPESMNRDNVDIEKVRLFVGIEKLEIWAVIFSLLVSVYTFITRSDLP
jgi:hypothetical protein